MRGAINLTLSGFATVGYDIGGWDSKGPDDLYARWFAAGMYNPFAWSHGQEDHEPYSHGAAVEDICRAARERLDAGSYGWAGEPANGLIWVRFADSGKRMKIVIQAGDIKSRRKILAYQALR